MAGFLAYIIPVDTGARPNQDLPGQQPGGIWGPGFPYPDQGLPGSQPRPDNTLPGNQPYPDQGLPGSQPRPDPNAATGSGAPPASLAPDLLSAGGRRATARHLGPNGPATGYGPSR